MNDEFLYQLYEEPEPEFIKSLHERLVQASYTDVNHSIKAQSFISRHLAAKRMVLALIALSLTFGMALAISPTVRAAVTDFIKTIIVRGVSFQNL